GGEHPLRLRLQLLPAFQRVEALRVDDFALLIHDVVELQQLFPSLEILELDPLLGLPDRGGHPRMGDDLPLFRAGPVHDARDPVRPEEAHQIVFERQIEDARARISLASRAPAQLAIDAPGLVALGPNDDEAAGRILVALELLDLLRAHVRLLEPPPERRLARLHSSPLALLYAHATLADR